MARAVKRKLSGSTDGMPIIINASASGTAGTIHAAVAGQVAGTFDEIWLWAQNNGTANYALTVEFGGTAAPIKVTIPYQDGLVPVVPGLILQNSLKVTAFAGSSGLVAVSGFVNSITD